jgi:type I restriction enzyme R subunit
MEHDQSLGKVMWILPRDDTKFDRQFAQNESFRRFVGDMVFAIMGAKPSAVPRPCGDLQLGL